MDLFVPQHLRVLLELVVDQRDTDQAVAAVASYLDELGNAAVAVALSTCELGLVVVPLASDHCRSSCLVDQLDLVVVDGLVVHLVAVQVDYG